MKSKNAIVIPIYKSQLSLAENISISQAYKIFQAHDIFLVSPENMLVKNYETMNYKYFPEKYFRSISTYNELMLSQLFYMEFKSYEYILIYQPDAFVFSDKLQHFCRMNYDYIGAPWLDGLHYSKENKSMIYRVGNGGFSLRRVESFLELLESKKDEAERLMDNEDYWFARQADERFRVAPIEVALQFSFEREVKQCYLKNGNRIPFGCHAWLRYDYLFWKPYIESYGYKTDDSWAENKGEDENYVRKKYNRENLKLAITPLFYDEPDDYIVFGAGKWGRSLVYRMKCIDNMQVSFICDNNVALTGKLYIDTEIINFDMLLKRRTSEGIIIAVKDCPKEIIEQFERAGLKYRIDFIFMSEIKDKF